MIFQPERQLFNDRMQTIAVIRGEPVNDRIWDRCILSSKKQKQEAAAIR
jgi:hypothetical protein